MPKARKTKRYFEPKKKIENGVAPQAVSAPGVPPPSSRPATAKIKSLAERYPYVTNELKRIAILSGIIFVILVVLALALP